MPCHTGTAATVLPPWAILRTLPQAALAEEAQIVGGDIARLLNMLPPVEKLDLDSRNEIQELKKVWEDEFSIDGNTIQWRVPGCASCICSHLGEFDR